VTHLKRNAPTFAILVVILLVWANGRMIRGQNAGDVILRAADAPVRAGGWIVVSDMSAAGGSRIHFPNAGAAKIVDPIANPTKYFEMTFDAEGGVPYRLWMRGKAESNHYFNDSVFVQFSDSVTSGGEATFRIGSPSATTYNLEDCGGCGLSGWGWQDNGWGVGVYGDLIRFASTGTHTLRVQVREDGLSIDQIVLSPSRYLTSSPGALKNDTVILTGTPPPPPPPPPTPSGVTVVRHPYLQVFERAALIVWASAEAGRGRVIVAGRSFDAATTYYPASTTGMTVSYYQHAARIDNLEPFTTYGYQVFVDDASGGGGSFRTAPQTGTGSVRFIAFGDSGVGSTAQMGLAARMAADTFDLALHTGDIAYGSTSTSGDASYKTYQSWFFDIYRDWLPNRAFFPTMGNHDARASNGYGTAYLNLFALPDGGGAGAFPDHAERYYSFDYGPVHFVALDTELAFTEGPRRQAQLDWLESDLSSTVQPWKVVFFHRPPYNSGLGHGSDLVVRQVFGPMLERHGVQLALTAHEHNYERSVPWRESTDRAKQAVTYFVTGGGGTALYSTGKAAWTAFSRKTYHYLRVIVSGCTLTTEAVDGNGAMFDRFILNRCQQAADLASPTVRITAPLAGAQVSGNVAITVTATDDVRVEKVDFVIDGVLKSIDRLASYAYNWDSRTVPAGAHTIEALAYDIDGNRVVTRVTVNSTGS
jgi:acid phosphatase type 7